MRTADWNHRPIIDLGVPAPATSGGRIVFAGTPATSIAARSTPQPGQYPGRLTSAPDGYPGLHAPRRLLGRSAMYIVCP